MRSSLIAIALLFAGATLAGPTLGEGARDRAKERYFAGEAAFKMGRFEEALEEYTAAHQLAPHPDMLFNIAQCHRNLHQFDKAIFFLERYLQESRRFDDREQIEALIDELRRLDSLSLKPEPIVDTRVVTSTEAASSVLPAPIEGSVEPPIYQRPWFWGVVVGAAAVVGGAVAIAVVSQRDRAPDGDYEFDLR